VCAGSRLVQVHVPRAQRHHVTDRAAVVMKGIGTAAMAAASTKKYLGSVLEQERPSWRNQDCTSKRSLQHHASRDRRARPTDARHCFSPGAYAKHPVHMSDIALGTLARRVPVPCLLGGRELTCKLREAIIGATMPVSFCSFCLRACLGQANTHSLHSPSFQAGYSFNICCHKNDGLSKAESIRGQ